ncbi:MAG: phosphotransferase family protein [Dehalococcoidia bacterium]
MHLDRLKAFLEATAGPGYEVSELQPLSGGYSNETFAFQAHHKGKDHHMILRKQMESGGILQTDLAAEFRAIECLHRRGFPVCKVHWLDATGEFLGQPGFVMERVGGTSKPEPLFQPGAEPLLKKVSTEIIDALGELHSLEPSELSDTGLAVPDDWEGYINAQINEMEAGFDAILLEGLPAVAEMFRWLRRNIPEPLPFRLVHCDYQMANFMYDDTGLKAIIDWELVHFGDPREDLGWLQIMCLLFGFDIRPHVEGGFLERYSERSGLPVTPEGVLFFQILRGLAVTWGVMRNAHGFAVGTHRDIMAPYLQIPVQKGTRLQLESMGMTHERLGQLQEMTKAGVA